MVIGTVMLSIVNDAKVVWAKLFANPEPMSVTVVPTAAEDGVTMVIAGAPVFVKVAEPLIPAVVMVCGPDPDAGTVNTPIVDGGVGQVFAAHAVAAERAEPSKLIAPELAGVVRNPESITVVP